MDENESIITKAAKDFKAKSGAVIQRLNRVCGDSARQYPAEYVEVERREAMAELAALESAMLGTAGQAHERELAVADEIYAKDPRDHSAVMADELQITRLSRMHPDKISARNNLVGEARRLASLGAFDGARVHLEAARLSGAVDSALDKQVQQHYDSTLPNRKAAIEAKQESVAPYTEARLAAITARNLASALVGDRVGMARSSIAAKNTEMVRAEAEGRQYSDPGTSPS